ncbi:MAG: hypothetical protein K6T88_08360 [Bacillus sp. (in: Bacteria)]|nr:hypothetical protein [Bacillus sp. (in: firmicutes)]
MQDQLTKDGIHYWKLYSDFGTWQVWFILAMLIGPLILLFFLIDRKNIFVIGFFGFAVHILFAYVDAFGIRYGLWGYPYQLLPFLPSFSIDGVIIPITIMLVFQWTNKHKKNYYLYSFITAVIFGFGFKPLLVSLSLFEKYKWINYFYIFLIYLVLFLVAYWIIKLFLWMQTGKKSEK